MPLGDPGISQDHRQMADHEERIAIANRDIRFELEAAINSQNLVDQDWESPQAKDVWLKVQNEWRTISDEMTTILQAAGISVGDIRMNTQRTDGQVAQYFEMPPIR